jgi:hypothetical protein
MRPATATTDPDDAPAGRLDVGLGAAVVFEDEQPAGQWTDQVNERAPGRVVGAGRVRRAALGPSVRTTSRITDPPAMRRAPWPLGWNSPDDEVSQDSAADRRDLRQQQNTDGFEVLTDRHERARRREHEHAHEFKDGLHPADNPLGPNRSAPAFLLLAGQSSRSQPGLQ